MDANARILADALAQHVVDRNFAAARELFAPWLQARVAAAEFEGIMDRANEGLPPPRSWTLDENTVRLDELRETSRFRAPNAPMPAEVTNANYRGWICVQFVPDPDNEEGFDSCFDLWIAAVQDGPGCKVGHFLALGAS